MLLALGKEWRRKGIINHSVILDEGRQLPPNPEICPSKLPLLRESDLKCANYKTLQGWCRVVHVPAKGASEEMRERLLAYGRSRRSREGARADLRFNMAALAYAARTHKGEQESWVKSTTARKDYRLTDGDLTLLDCETNPEAKHGMRRYRLVDVAWLASRRFGRDVRWFDDRNRDGPRISRAVLEDERRKKLKRCLREVGLEPDNWINRPEVQAYCKKGYLEGWRELGRMSVRWVARALECIDIMEELDYDEDDLDYSYMYRYVVLSVGSADETVSEAIEGWRAGQMFTAITSGMTALTDALRSCM